ncbi:VOC family protein [Falsiroseomonas sp. HW251]|uniref:VOC family protein n=1 Tax=Falsiroseomonas sp. HW251 TaxID=3390998 RepID=UPI003D3103F1
MIQALGYIGIRAAQPTEWDGFATRLLGMQRVDRGGGTHVFRMDDRAQRLVVTPEADDGLAFMGWEVADAAALDALAAKLEAAGIAVERGSRALADERHVAGLIVFRDPGGNRLEVFHGQEVADEPFKPGRPISGFRTGPFGMGHAVLHVKDAQALAPFYRDTLGFGLSDYGRKPYDLFFFHVNGRHHSFAMVGSGRAGIHHFMVELGSLDDVGQGYDLATAEKDRVAYSLGRHTNDWMTSFYANTPSGFFVEYGWGGRIIDPATWQPHETFDGPSYWGHERLHLPEDGARAHLRAMRMDAAARGLRAPDPQPSTGCAWADATIRQN